jgi:hypothetical protein
MERVVVGVRLVMRFLRQGELGVIVGSMRTGVKDVVLLITMVCFEDLDWESIRLSVVHGTWYFQLRVHKS